MKKFLYIVPILFLSACSAQVPIILYPTLPATITAPCDKPVADIKTNGDLLNYTVELKGDLSECSTKQKALVDAIHPVESTSKSTDTKS